jgi:hypothetical protein
LSRTRTRARRIDTTPSGSYDALRTRTCGTRASLYADGAWLAPGRARSPDGLRTGHTWFASRSPLSVAVGLPTAPLNRKNRGSVSCPTSFMPQIITCCTSCLTGRHLLTPGRRAGASLNAAGGGMAG